MQAFFVDVSYQASNFCQTLAVLHILVCSREYYICLQAHNFIQEGKATSTIIVFAWNVIEHQIWGSVLV